MPTAAFGIERRRDPRTSKPFSLKNLLATRAERDGLVLAVVGTGSGFLMASSRPGPDKQAARIAAHVSAELFKGTGTAHLTRSAPSWPDMRLLAVRIDAGCEPAFVAALVSAHQSFSLDALAECVTRILCEPLRAVGAAA